MISDFPKFPSPPNDFSLPIETHPGFLKVGDLDDTVERPCDMIYLVLPVFILQVANSRKRIDL